MKTGFTLIELLVVIGIISTLIGIVLPRMEGVREQANIIKAKAEVRALQAAIESYFINQRPAVYPPSTPAICAGVLNTVQPLIIAEKLYDPFVTTQPTEYQYLRSANGRFYVVFSAGMNQQKEILGITNSGQLEGTINDDIYATNGNGV